MTCHTTLRRGSLAQKQITEEKDRKETGLCDSGECFSVSLCYSTEMLSASPPPSASPPADRRARSCRLGDGEDSRAPCVLIHSWGS
ncbi:hypothetical protein SKAU_G00399240 [Synaphobranchus kaupii]|uniref:Uncharacterized protein n=1 Tax=Synaphobranchus kaupii TaxID=118154 RepID=A0A9Q1E8Q0_SYNKA|nr:hypothetical protein SKAU_G00399240 [Synaphobranchus kaupii]